MWFGGDLLVEQGGRGVLSKAQDGLCAVSGPVGREAGSAGKVWLQPGLEQEQITSAKLASAVQGTSLPQALSRF